MSASFVLHFKFLKSNLWVKSCAKLKLRVKSSGLSFQKVKSSDLSFQKVKRVQILAFQKLVKILTFSQNLVTILTLKISNSKPKPEPQLCKNYLLETSKWFIKKRQLKNLWRHWAENDNVANCVWKEWFDGTSHGYSINGSLQTVCRKL